MSIYEKLKQHPKCLNNFTIIAILYWSAQLLNSQAYYVPYLLISILSILSYIYNSKYINLLQSDINIYSKRLVIFFSIIFSLMVTLANYNLGRTVSLLLLFLTGFTVFQNILTAVIFKLQVWIWREEIKNYRPNKIFIISFLSIVFINLTIFFACFYPGILTPDSISQITQILSGNYSNHHPFYHTQVIKCLFTLGMYLFNDINAAVATYSVFQIIFMASCFALTLSTLSHIKVPSKILLLIGAFYALMPYHIMYSFTMWKDVMFGAFILLLITFIFRITQDIGNCYFNYISLFISSMGTCLFRSNGFFAFVLLTIFLFLLFKTKQQKMLIVFIIAILISVIMKYPVLGYLNVRQPDTMEALSIPAQQIARVVVEKRALTSNEKQLLEKVIDINEIPKKYKPFISDNIKNLVRQKGNQHLLKEKKNEYLNLYISLGLKYPTSYARAWIDETKGYWNSGYEYWRWSKGIKENKLGIKLTPLSEKANSFLNRYLNVFTKVQILRTVLCIGLFVWLNILMIFISLYRKDKIGILVTIPTIMVALSLLIATPVFSEFRYIYSIFCALPLISVIVLRPSINKPINMTEENLNV